MPWMTWRAMGLADIACHVIGYRLTQDTREQNALDDVAGTCCSPRGRMPFDTRNKAANASDVAIIYQMTWRIMFGRPRLGGGVVEAHGHGDLPLGRPGSGQRPQVGPRRSRSHFHNPRVLLSIASDDVAIDICQAQYCAPRHRMPLN